MVAPPARDTKEKMLRFLFVGGGFAIGYSILSAVLVGPFAMPAFATSVLLYAICIPLAYFAQRRITFASKLKGPKSFVVYGATQLGSLALVATVTTRFVTETVLVDTLIFLLTAGAAAVVSFYVSDRIAFRT